MTAESRGALIAALEPNLHERGAILGDATPLETWAAPLPERTLVLYDPATVRAVREIVEVMRAGTHRRIATPAGGGHLAPPIRPDPVNPLVAADLAERRRCNDLNPRRALPPRGWCR